MAKTDKSLEAVARERARIFEEAVLPGLEYLRSEPIIPRCNKEGKKAEQVIGAILGISGYHIREQQPYGRAHGRPVVVDFLCALPYQLDKWIVVSVKFQRSKGSWDEKIPAEVAKLDSIITNSRGWVVLIGTGVDKEKRARWCAGLLDTGKVRVVGLDQFIEKAFTHNL